MLYDNIFFTKGVYRISSSSPKYSVLTGGAMNPTVGVCGYYAMDPNGVGTAKEFYTYAPIHRERNERLVIFAYEDDTSVTVRSGNGNGVYTNLTSGVIDNGERMGFAQQSFNQLDNKYLHISADKPVSVLTVYDYGYIVPASTGKWSGKKFHTCVNNVKSTFLDRTYFDEQDLVISAFDNDTLVSITETDTGELVWQGLIDGGKSYIKNFPENQLTEPEYYTIESDKTVSVTVAGPGKLHHQLLADRLGTGIGNWNNEVVGPSRVNITSDPNYLVVLGYHNNTPVDCWNMITGEIEQSFTVNRGKYKTIFAGPGQWKFVSGGPISVYAGIDGAANAEFVPLVFDAKGGLPYLSKTAVIENNADEVDPTNPNANQITYTISYGNPITNPADPNYIGTITGLQLFDMIPSEAVIGSSNQQGTFSLLSNSYVWDIGTLTPGQSGSVTLTVQIAATALPATSVTNWAKLSNDDYEVFAKVQTPVACWSDDVVYVKPDAKGKQDGSSWNDAYKALYRAMEQVRKCNNPAHYHEIWVARGTYHPTHSSDITAAFDLIEGVNIYGGFEGNETAVSQRNWYNNKCTLSGGIGGSDVSADSDYVVRSDADVTTDTEFDGFTITRSGIAGFYALEGCPSVYNCNITESQNDGIYIDDAQAVIKTTSVFDNADHGIYCASGSLTLDRCKIAENNVGIDCDSVSSTVTNSWIHNNTGNGINVGSSATIRNNTILSNGSYGLFKAAQDTPTIRNTIIWDNGLQLLRGWETQYCCITNIDPNNFNINTNPQLAYDGFRDFHLSVNSPCIDAGDSTGITSELDLDDDDRIYGTQVDIGADELDCTDVSHAMDFDADGVINMSEFAVFANAWDSWAPGATSDPNDAIRWNAACDFEEDEHIDTGDLVILAENWLWQACWRQTGGMSSMMSMPMNMSVLPQDPATDERKALELEQMLLWFKMVNMDPAWESQLGTNEWYQFIESLEETVEALKQQ